VTGTPSKARVAMLIDADNINLDYTKQILKIAERYGQLAICRAFGDWSKPPLSAWSPKMKDQKIERIQVDRVGKNATDHRLLLEVGETIGRYGGDNGVSVFVIVSGDGHFTPACNFLRERKKQVIGIGSKEVTKKSLRAACSKFFFLEELDLELSKFEKPKPAKKPAAVVSIDPDLESAHFNLILKAYAQVCQPDARALMSQLNEALRKLDPQYKDHFGSKRLSTWLKGYPGKFKIDGHYVSLVE
jgi:hypothetical protein